MNTVQMPIDKTRRKRLKVISACGECRRKKTKCNGEKPCSGCIKANVDCKYSNSPKSRPSATAVASTSTTAQRTHNNENNNSNNNNKSTDTISSIENRLSVIEDILHVLLLNSSSGREHIKGHRNSALNPERNMQPHSGPSYGEMYMDGYHRQSPREKRRYEEMDRSDYYWVAPPPSMIRTVNQPVTNFPPTNESVRLPPLHIQQQQPPLSESSSTSTTSSTCSAYSPKINTIQTLLNEEDEKKVIEHRPSAFFKPTSAGSGRY
ncbi:hypothetical protein K501DRAFT_234601 [Backusella circina FSU 941]|nr:hypothetical protein K501DRAFT_234601 [Backusella circina FSU 941]